MELLNINGTIVAVLLNFLILLWILNRYLYKPVLGILEGRKQQVESTVADAEKKLVESQQLKGELEKKLAAARSEAQNIVDEALKTSERIRQELTAEGRNEANAIRERAIAEVSRIKDAARKELKSDTVDLAILAAGKLLKRSVDEAGNRKYVEEVLNELKL